MPQGLTLEQAQALGFKPKGLTLEEAQAQGFKPAPAKPAEPMKPVEAGIGDILSRFGSPNDQPETVMQKLSRAFSREPTGGEGQPKEIVTGNESTGHPILDTLRSLVEGSVPGTAAVKGAQAVIPSKERAKAGFEAIKAVADKLPTNTSSAKKIAGEIEIMSEEGFKMPAVIRKFINKDTNAAGPLTFATTRNFEMAAGRLSDAGKRALEPAMKYKVREFWQAMKTANREVAEKVGMGDLFDAAQKEYRQAATLEQAAAALKKYGTKAAISALAGASATAAGYGIYRSMK